MEYINSKTSYCRDVSEDFQRVSGEYRNDKTVDFAMATCPRAHRDSVKIPSNDPLFRRHASRCMCKSARAYGDTNTPWRAGLHRHKSMW